MNSKTAIKELVRIGFVELRKGKGDHVIFQRAHERIVLSKGRELSLGMAGKVRSILNRESK
jgi:predicted RNA binding protein YcfA (HicA-like mRNA interferase family)